MVYKSTADVIDHEVNYFQYKYSLQLAILKYLYLNQFCLFSYPMLMKGFKYLHVGLVPSMRLDSRKDNPSVKPAWSVFHSELKAGVLPPREGKCKGCKMNIKPRTM